eukprot:scaffold74394_cov57-Phaeocystis_antarctica.AAC.1
MSRGRATPPSAVSTVPCSEASPSRASLLSSAACRLSLRRLAVASMPHAAACSAPRCALTEQNSPASTSTLLKASTSSSVAGSKIDLDLDLTSLEPGERQQQRCELRGVQRAVVDPGDEGRLHQQRGLTRGSRLEHLTKGVAQCGGAVARTGDEHLPQPIVRSMKGPGEARRPGTRPSHRLG